MKVCPDPTICIINPKWLCSVVAMEHALIAQGLYWCEPRKPYRLDLLCVSLALVCSVPLGRRTPGGLSSYTNSAGSPPYSFVVPVSALGNPQ